MILLWSRGGDTGSDFTFTFIGDVEGGGVLFDTAKCGKPLREDKKGRNFRLDASKCQLVGLEYILPSVLNGI